jgi:hypothetical protein
MKRFHANNQRLDWALENRIREAASGVRYICEFKPIPVRIIKLPWYKRFFTRQNVMVKVDAN